MLPKFLYHYNAISSDLGRRADRKLKQRLEETLLDDALYFAPPIGFNDPFDCHYIPELTEQCFKELSSHRPLERFVSVKRNKLLHTLNRDLQQLRSSFDHRSACEQLRDYIRANYGILCLSEHKDSIPMFAYYAGGHSGFCLEFALKPTEDEAFFNQVQKVQYTTQFPTLAFEHRSHKEILALMLATKCKVWQHEREWRIIKTPDELPKNRKLKFPQHLLTGIILGCSIAEADKGFIKQLLQKRKQRLKLIQAKPAWGQYAIDVSQEIDY